MKKQQMTELELQLATDRYDPIETQRQLQARILERFPDAPVLDREAPTVGEAAQVAYLNAQAVTMELMELLDHLPEWKWWKSSEDADMTLAAYDASHEGAVTEAKYELVDAAHFLANIAIALGMGWYEFLTIWNTKQQENFDRQERGY